MLALPYDLVIDFHKVKSPGLRDMYDSVVKSKCSQLPRTPALGGIWCPLMASTGNCTHVQYSHTDTQVLD